MSEWKPDALADTLERMFGLDWAITIVARIVDASEPDTEGDHAEERALWESVQKIYSDTELQMGRYQP